MSDNPPPVIKIVLIGDSMAGKTALVRRFTRDDFEIETLGPTIGVDFRIAYVNVDQTRYKLQIWDAAGPERFRTIMISYLRAAQGIIVVCDPFANSSMNAVGNTWLKPAVTEAPSATKMILSNKIDLDRPRQISKTSAKKYASEQSVTYVEASAKTGEGVDDAFLRLVASITKTPLKNVSLVESPVAPTSLDDAVFVTEEETQYIIEAELPGVPKDKLDIRVEGNGTEVVLEGSRDLPSRHTPGSMPILGGPKDGVHFLAEFG